MPQRDLQAATDGQDEIEALDWAFGSADPDDTPERGSLRRLGWMELFERAQPELSLLDVTRQSVR